MELEFLKEVDPAMQRLYMERAAFQDKMLEAVTRPEPGWKLEYEDFRRDLGQLDARIIAEHSPQLIAAMNDLYLAVLEIQMTLFPADPVPDLDSELALKDRRSSTREQFEQLSATARKAASRMQSFACIPQGG
jgi:hypothetical protein